MKRYEIRAPIPQSWFRKLFRLKPRHAVIDVTEAVYSYDEGRNIATFYRLEVPMYVWTGSKRHVGPVKIKANLTGRQKRKAKAEPRLRAVDPQA